MRGTTACSGGGRAQAASGTPQPRGLVGRRDGGHTLGLLSRPPAQIRGRQSELGQASGPPGGPHLLLPQVRGLGRPEISQGSGKAELSADDGCLPPAPPPASIWTLHIPSSVRGRERTFTHTWEVTAGPTLPTWEAGNPSLPPHPLPGPHLPPQRTILELPGQNQGGLGARMGGPALPPRPQPRPASAPAPLTGPRARASPPRAAARSPPGWP